MHSSSRLSIDCIKYWQANYDYQLKFVIDCPEDETEIIKLLDQISPADAEQIYLMPQGCSKAELSKNTELCIDMANRHGWQFTPRLHIETFGLKRGC